MAKEIARRIITHVIAAGDKKTRTLFKKTFETKDFHVVESDDLRGAELCGALKNVYSIAVGMAGEKVNTAAALFTQALNEMCTFVQKAGGQRETVRGLAGVGDLEATCRSGRNTEFGKLLGSGLSPKAALERMNTTVEGYETARLAYKMAFQLKLDLPLLKKVYKTIAQ